MYFPTFLLLNPHSYQPTAGNYIYLLLTKVMDERYYQKESLCWVAFKYFDPNGDKKITKHELLEALNRVLPFPAVPAYAPEGIHANGVSQFN